MRRWIRSIDPVFRGWYYVAVLCAWIGVLTAVVLLSSCNRSQPECFSGVPVTSTVTAECYWSGRTVLQCAMDCTSPIGDPAEQLDIMNLAEFYCGDRLGSEVTCYVNAD